MTVLNISHDDLDGFACSVIIEDYLNEQSIGGHWFFENVGYHELEGTLENAFKEVTTPYEWLILTDLNIGPRIINLLLNNTAKYKHFTLIDHHKNDEALLSTLREALEHEGIECDILIQQGLSATMLAYSHLMMDTDDVVESDVAITCVKAWDVHDLSGWDNIHTGQLIHDLVYEMVNVFRPALTHGLFNWLMNRATRLLMDGNIIHAADTHRGMETDFKFDLPERLLEAVAAIGEDIKDLVSHYNLRSTIMDLGFQQALSLIAAFLAMPTQDGDWTFIHEFDNGDSYRFHFTNEALSFGVIHHWLYTLKCFDGVALRRAGKGVSLRQNEATGTVDLSKMAHQFQGGGHHNAAGIPESGVSALSTQSATPIDEVICGALFNYLNNVFKESQ